MLNIKCYTWNCFLFKTSPREMKGVYVVVRGGELPDKFPGSQQLSSSLLPPFLPPHKYFSIIVTAARGKFDKKLYNLTLTN